MLEIYPSKKSVPEKTNPKGQKNLNEEAKQDEKEIIH